MAEYTVTINVQGSFDPNIALTAIRAATDIAISTTMAMTRNRWIEIVQNTLHSTRADYLLGLEFGSSMQQPYDDTPDTNGAVVLNGAFPKMLERGWQAYDEKPFLLASPKAKITKNGKRVMTVPFRHGTPGTFMYGTPMPEPVYNKAKKLKAGEVLRVPGVGEYSWTGYQHRGGKIQNRMQRILKENQRGSFYMTWRNVSENSDFKSWWNSGFRGVHAVERVAGYAHDTFVRVMQDTLNSVII